MAGSRSPKGEKARLRNSQLRSQFPNIFTDRLDQVRLQKCKWFLTAPFFVTFIDLAVHRMAAKESP
jgi:hypothetical protein